MSGKDFNRNIAAVRDSQPVEQLEQPDWVKKSGRVASQQVQKIYADSFIFHHNGLEIIEGLEESVWWGFSEILVAVRTKWHWVAADWLAFGEHSYGDKIYERVAKELGGSPDTWRDYAYIARHVEFSLRNENVSFKFHRFVAPYGKNPELQRDLLAIVEQHKLTERVFKAIVPLHVANKDYTHLLGKLTPVQRATLSADKKRNSILNKADGKHRTEWLTFAEQEAKKWTELAKKIKALEEKLT